MPFGILGSGSYVPDRVLNNHDLEKMVDTNDEWIRSRTGIVERRIAAEGQASSDMAAEAGNRALADAGLTPEDIDMVVVGTFSPDHLIPSTACHVQEKMEIPNCGAYDLNAACSGFMYGMSTAHGLLVTGVAKKVLLIGVDTMSRFLDWEDRNTCVLFGDGAGAMILGEVEEGKGILGAILSADGRMGNRIMIPAGGSAKPVTTEVLENHEQYLKMEGGDVFKFAVRIMSEALRGASERAGVTVEDLDWVVPHQANIRIIDGAIRRLKMDRDKFIVNLDKYGNTTAATVPLAWDEAVRDGRIKRGDLVGLVAFGGGLTWGSSVVRF